jgi:predicted Zn finger-like uncharacterized protein
VALSVVCPNCDAKLRLRDELAGRTVKCSACGEPIDVPEDRQPAEGARGRPKRQASREPEKGGLGVVLWLLGGVALLLAIGIVFGVVRVYKWANAESTNLPAIVKATDPSSADPPRKPAPMLDERKTLQPGTEWSREVTSQFGGALPFRISSQGPFSLTVVNKRGYDAARSKAAIDKNDVLLTADSKGTEYEDRVTLPGGRSYFIIANKSTNAAEIHLECFPRY